jgi:HEAT repeat protein
VLNRRLVLDRLEDTTSSKRLRGVMDAASMAAGDTEIAHALLVRATQDRVPSVRSAAIDALGSSTTTPAIGEQIMSLLAEAESPIVQLALVDLVLRYGNVQQIDQLLTLAEQERLHPDLQRHVSASEKRDIA